METKDMWHFPHLTVTRKTLNSKTRIHPETWLTHKMEIGR